MCTTIPCSTCGKTTWAGCGQHVDSVMARVLVARRCTCERAAAAPSRLRRWFSRR